MLILAVIVDVYIDVGLLFTTLTYKTAVIYFKIINFPNMCSNIPASPAYGCLHLAIDSF
jgi:hypothetical protein